MTGDLLNNTPVTQLQAQQFNMLTPGNEMKWDTTQPSPPPAAFNFTPGQNIVNYAARDSRQALRVRGRGTIQTDLPIGQGVTKYGVSRSAWEGAPQRVRVP
jgi:endo-1,4-beta-xylanase